MTEHKTSRQALSIGSDTQTKCVNTIRLLSADAVQAANSGHPGLPMGMAQAAFSLWSEHLRHSPANPSWSNRDRFYLECRAWINADLLALASLWLRSTAG